ncbi:hypothetical protein JOS77_19520 [Chromobacterium haemolyticum]|nr:hypothetical protein JOS77_19520 [Chromobacterium haemolyticum]
MHDLLIRKVEPEDAPALAAMMVSEEVVANTLQLPYQSVEDWRRNWRKRNRMCIPWWPVTAMAG